MVQGLPLSGVKVAPPFVVLLREMDKQGLKICAQQKEENFGDPRLSAGRLSAGKA